MPPLLRKISFKGLPPAERRLLLRREWLATNGLGGYASGTLSGSVTWRYHGLLVAALPAPFGRTVMLNHLAEFLRLPDGRRLPFGGDEPGPTEESVAAHHLVEFRLENLLPVWRYEIENVVLEKSVLLIHNQNTVHLTYRLLSGPSPVVIEACPSLHFRGHEASVAGPLEEGYRIQIDGRRFEISDGTALPGLRLCVHGDFSFRQEGSSRREIVYQKDADRGYESRGSLWSPGLFSLALTGTEPATLLASTESWGTLQAFSPAEALQFYHERQERLISLASPKVRQSPAADLVLAADQFVITPSGRFQDAARSRARGDEVRTVIAGYHWFTDWGRDTMISLEGLTLTTGRALEAGWILRTFAHYTRDGLIPNMFPEGKNEGLYHTADATLWFFHALDRYLTATADRATLRLILPKLLDIARHHLHGTRFGIGVDPADGLLRQGQEGYQLTWMDAKVDDWVVTPRRGKAVEINALWHNALRLLEGWLREEGDAKTADEMAGHARQAAESFNARFWFSGGEYLFDVIDGERGDDPAFRPNQVLAISLRHPVLDPRRWARVMQVVGERLLTPVGLRSLSRDHPDYKAQYSGDLRARDAAYHQGTVWAWLIGPFIDAWLKVHPDDKTGARKFLEGFGDHLNEACVGSISEIFDAEKPFAPRGCIAQAWSVAEVLRCWEKTEA